MPKTKQIESVLHDWVHTLPFQQQALLMTAMRGPDGMHKYCLAKTIVRYLRGVVLKPAGNWNGKNDNDFMWGDISMLEEYIIAFWRSHDEYPHHFIMHILHSAEVVGYRHPNDRTRELWCYFYYLGCQSFHMHMETLEQMDARLSDFGCGIQALEQKEGS